MKKNTTQPSKISSLFRMKHLMCLFACTSLSNAAVADEKPLVILLGDSIRMNYQLDVANRLKDTAVVWGPEENCKDTVYFMANLDKWLEGKNPAVIHFNVGAHDIFQDTPGKPRRTPEEYSENLRKIITSLQARCPNATIIFANITPVIEERQAQSEVYKRVVRTNADVDKMNLAALKVLEEYNVGFNDIHKICVESDPKIVLRDDGTHLTDKGSWIVSGQTADKIKQALDARALRNKQP